MCNRDRFITARGDVTMVDELGICWYPNEGGAARTFIAVIFEAFMGRSHVDLLFLRVGVHHTLA